MLTGGVPALLATAAASLLVAGRRRARRVGGSGRCGCARGRRHRPSVVPAARRRRSVGGCWPVRRAWPPVCCSVGGGGSAGRGRRHRRHGTAAAHPGARRRRGAAAALLRRTARRLRPARGLPGARACRSAARWRPSAPRFPHPSARTSPRSRRCTGWGPSRGAPGRTAPATLAGLGRVLVRAGESGAAVAPALRSLAADCRADGPRRDRGRRPPRRGVGPGAARAVLPPGVRVPGRGPARARHRRRRLRLIRRPQAGRPVHRSPLSPRRRPSRPRGSGHGPVRGP